MEATVSILALIVSVFTFYWTSLRKKKELHLIRIDSPFLDIGPKFALVNSGSFDVLLTTVFCSFENGPGSWITPGQNLETPDTNSSLLQAGHALKCAVRIPPFLTEEQVKLGELYMRGEREVYIRKMKVGVSWVDGSGEERSGEALISTYGFDVQGKIVLHIPETKRVNLYKSKS